MPTVLSEGEGNRRITFKFSDMWQVYKYDEPIAGNVHFEIRNQGLKAVDFLATSDQRILLMEVKFIRSSDQASTLSLDPKPDRDDAERIRNQLSDEDKKKVDIVPRRPWIVDEVVKKTRDTLLGLLASDRQADQRLSPYTHALLIEKKPIILVLFLERHLKLNQEQDFKPLATRLRLALEQKMTFLGNIEVLVTNTRTLPTDELGISASSPQIEC